LSITSFVEKPAIKLQSVSHIMPATYTGYPPYMSASRPKIKRNDATVKEKALAGHVDEAAGMCKSLARVGRMTVNPETKYSYLGSGVE
jgi:hypothetical protein